MLPQHNTEGPSVAFRVGVIPPSPTDTTSEEIDNYVIIRDEENAGDGEESRPVLSCNITAISTERTAMERTESARPTASKLMDGYTLPSDGKATENIYNELDNSERDFGAIQTSSSSIVFENARGNNPDRNSVYRLPLAPPVPCRPVTSLNSQDTKEVTPYNMTFTLMKKQDEEYSLPVKRRMDKRIVLLCVALCGVALIAVALGVVYYLKVTQSTTPTPTTSTSPETTLTSTMPPKTSTEPTVTQSTTPTPTTSTSPETTLTSTMPPKTSTEPTDAYTCFKCGSSSDPCPSNGNTSTVCRNIPDEGCISYIDPVSDTVNRNCFAEDDYQYWKGLEPGCHNTSEGHVCLCKEKFCNTHDMRIYQACSC